MLANLLVIGAPRSGTTSLYEYLASHPDVAMSKVKEPDFFARPELTEVHPFGGPIETGSLSDDVAGHARLSADLTEYEQLWSHATTERCRGEASAMYLGDPGAAWHLRRYTPDARFVVILRDPAERAHSHFIHAKRIYADHGHQSATGTDDTFVDDEFARAVDVASREGMPEQATSEPEIWVRAGFYHAHLTRWFELFPREQFAIFLYEDLVDDADALMRQVFAHAGVDDSFTLPTTEAFNASVVPRNQKLFTAFTTTNPVMQKAKALAPTRIRAVAARTRNRLLGSAKPEIDSDLRDTLRGIYRDDTIRLQELIGTDLSAWTADA